MFLISEINFMQIRKVFIRNKKTGEIKNIKIGELFDSSEYINKLEEIIQTNHKQFVKNFKNIVPLLGLQNY
jgi:hypothetical protein